MVSPPRRKQECQAINDQGTATLRILATCDPPQVWVVEGGPAPTSGGKRKQLDPGTILVSVWSQGSQNLLFGHPGAQVRVKGAARQVCGLWEGPASPAS